MYKIRDADTAKPGDLREVIVIDDDLDIEEGLWQPTLARKLEDGGWILVAGTEYLPFSY